MNQLRPGGRAVVINSLMKENIGKEVELVCQSDQERVMMPNGYYSLCAVKGSIDNWVVCADLTMRVGEEEPYYVIKSKYGYYPASYLMPIGDNPDEVTEQVEQTDLVPA